jgi:hypothetical protein
MDDDNDAQDEAMRIYLRERLAVVLYRAGVICCFLPLFLIALVFLIHQWRTDATFFLVIFFIFHLPVLFFIVGITSMAIYTKMAKRSGTAYRTRLFTGVSALFALELLGLIYIYWNLWLHPPNLS